MLQRRRTRSRVSDYARQGDFVPPNRNRSSASRVAAVLVIARSASVGLSMAILVVTVACDAQRDRAAARAEALTLLTIPRPGLGRCERGPFRGDFMAGAPPRGSSRVALELGNAIFGQQSVRVILDSAGRALSFRDELVYHDGAAAISEAVSVRFGVDGSVGTGMEHHHELRAERSAITGDRPLAADRYPAVIQAARHLRERCGA